jgi:hypothetical protein
MRIRVLYFEGCPHHAPALERVRRVAADLGVEADIEDVEIRNTSEAKDLRFLGSPTVQIDGHDIEPGAETRSDYAMSCRMYGPLGVPSRTMIEEAIRKRSVG